MFLHLYRPGSYCPWRDFKTLRQAIRMYDLTNPYTLADMNPSDWLYSSTACLFKAVAKIPRVNHSFQVAFWRFLSLSPALRKASRGHIHLGCLQQFIVALTLMQTIIAWKLIILKCNKAISTEAPLSQSFDPDYDKVSAIVEVSLPPL